MRKLVPLILALVGIGAGVGAGLALRPPPTTEAELSNPCGEAATAPDLRGKAAAAAAHGDEPAVDGEPSHDYVKLNNQFVVPVVEGGEVAALVILTLSLEVIVGGSEQVYAREPKIRDGFLQVLFAHANAGGFAGAFTDANNLAILRRALLEIAQKTLGTTVTDVLIVDIVRQDN